MYEKPNLRKITENVLKVISDLRPEMLPYSQDQSPMHILQLWPMESSP